MDKLDVLMVGIGGGGVILGSDITAEVALAAGYDVKKTDTIGMAQRGASVTSNVRFGSKVWSPIIKQGAADILVGFEKLETARWANYLRPDGVLIINNYAVPPLSVNTGLEKYPTDEEISEIARMRTERIYFVDAFQRTTKLGDSRMMNIYLLGCLSVFTPFITLNIWESKIRERLPARVIDINLTAFGLGRKELGHATA